LRYHASGCLNHTLSSIDRRGRRGSSLSDGATVLAVTPNSEQIFTPHSALTYSNTVGSGAIRKFFGSLDRYKATKGLFVTASTFSPSARQTAEQLSKWIVLIDGDRLTRLMISHGVGCRIEETLSIKKVDEEFFE